LVNQNNFLSLAHKDKREKKGIFIQVTKGLSVLLLIGIQFVSGQPAGSIPDISRFDRLEGAALRDSVGLAYESLLSIHDYTLRNRLARELFDFTAGKD